MIIINARFLTQKLTGVQRFAIEISKLLKAELPGVQFVAPANIIDTNLAKLLDTKIIGSHTGVLWEQFDLPIYLYRNKQPLLINFCNAAPLLYKNQVVTIHDLAFLENPLWFSKNFVRFYKFLIPKIAKKAKIIFTVSHFSKNEIVKHYNIDPIKIVVVYNSVTAFPISEKPVNEHGRYILIVGSLDKRKYIHNLIEAFHKLKDDNLKLLIAGDVNSIFNNTDNNSLKSNVNVLVLGRVTDNELSQLYSNALIFIYPSLYEGFGIPPLEAMYYGCATIVSDIESLREVCGDASLFVDPYNTDDIAQKIEFLANNEISRIDLIQKGKQNIKKYSWEKSAAIITDSIKNLN